MTTTELLPGLWLFSERGDSLMPENSYLLRLGSNPGDGFLLLDPSPELQLGQIEELLYNNGASLKQLKAVALTHDDFDVFRTLPNLAEALPSETVYVTSEEFLKMGAMAGIERERVRFPERHISGLLLPGASERIYFAPIPYCHAPSAFVIHAPWIACAFSGELLGGVLLQDESSPPYADPGAWRGIELYHQRHIPSTQALSYAISSVRSLNPLKLVCPIHGSLLEGGVLKSVLGKLSGLTAGADLLEIQSRQSELEPAWPQLLDEIEQIAEHHLQQTFEQTLAGAPSLQEVLKRPGDGDIESGFSTPGKLLETLLFVLTEDRPEEIAKAIRREAIQRSDQLGLEAVTPMLIGS